jgi:hypothetical protein
MQREVANQLLDRKVAEHTKELDLNYSRLRKRIEEENMNMSGTMADIKSTIASMKGLNSLAIKEERDTQDNQIQQMDLTIRHLSKILSGMQIRVVACEIENNKNYC